MIESKVIRQGDTLLLKVNDEILSPMAYLSYNAKRANYDDFKDAGIRLFETAVFAGDKGINPSSGIRAFRENFWVGEREFNFKPCEEDMERLIGNSKPGEIYIIPRITLNAPEWWEKKYPEELARDYAGSPCMQSLCSEKWLTDCVDVLKAFKDWLVKSGFDRYVAGWHLAAGHTEEFICPRMEDSRYLDYSPCAIRAFRRWCENEYKIIDYLNDSWGKEYASFDEIELPVPFERAFFPFGELRNADKERKVIDYHRFHSDVCAEAILKLCRASKELLDWKQITGVFYGYTTGSSPYRGHSAMKKLLESKEVDFFASPISYIKDRAVDVDWYFTGSVRSAQKANKLWFLEADVRTHLSKPIGETMPWAVADGTLPYYVSQVWYGPKTVEESKWSLLRCFARVMTHQSALWWFDLWGGWYDDKEYMATHKLMHSVYDEAMKSGKMKSSAEVVVFLDERLAFYCDEDAVTVRKYYTDFMLELGISGLPYDYYLMSDFESISPEQYKVAIFLSPLCWSEQEKEVLNKWKCNGRTIMFTNYPNGYFDIEIPDNGKTIVIEQDQAGEPLIVMSDMGDYRYISTKNSRFKGEDIRRFADYSGVHIYNYSNDIIYANSHFVAIVAANEGTKRIYLPEKGSLTNICTGDTLQSSQKIYVDLFMKKGEVHLFKINNAEK